MSRGGVYVYRCRKPGARLRIPILSYHFAYVGETTSFYHRHRQHIEKQPWSDLEPRVFMRIPVPRWKWLLRSVETAAILAVWPVYNHKKNLWNPRRIDLRTAAWQRRIRDNLSGWSPNCTYAHIAVFLAVVSLFIWWVTR